MLPLVFMLRLKNYDTSSTFAVFSFALQAQNPAKDLAVYFFLTAIVIIMT
jgi:hypothetical protein